MRVRATTSWEEATARAPHHNVSLNALIGGGTYAQPGEVSLYRGKISGPILERIDIQKSVQQVDYFELSGKKSAYTSAGTFVN